MPTASGTSKHWCGRAGEARAIASHMHDLHMLEVAERYERKARRSVAKLAGITLPPNNNNKGH